ncbi:MAG: hypothetical protein V2B18_14905 [Pseudomonadota bacterium]
MDESRRFVPVEATEVPGSNAASQGFPVAKLRVSPPDRLTSYELRWTRKPVFNNLVEHTMTGIEKTYANVGFHDKKTDFAYWLNQSYQVRLEAVEQIRKEFHKWKYGAEPRLQKVCSIVKQ